MTAAYPPPLPSSGVTTAPPTHIVTTTVNHIHHLANTGVNASQFIAIAIVFILIGGGLWLVSSSKRMQH